MLSNRFRQSSMNFIRYLSIAAPEPAKFEDFRTNENNTFNHSAKHLGRYYSIDPQDKKTLFSHGGFPKSFEKQIKTFGETCLMIREPAVEIINTIQSSNMKNCTNRYVLYGEDGVGKSLTLAHLIHYGYQNGFLIVHVPWVADWFKKPKEIANSVSVEGSVDLPLDSAAWLIHFKTQNLILLNKLDLKTTQDYVWSKRETTEKGSTLLQLIEHGITRVKFAPETVSVLLAELKQYAINDKCKVMVAIDGFNAFFYSQTRIKNDKREKMLPDQITITKPFKEITKYDWCNGVCILAVDRIALTEERWDSHFPLYQLGKEGFEHLDPFIPIEVNRYNDNEFQNCIDYYLNRRWIQITEPGFDTELKYLSSNNPYRLMKICISL